MAESMRAAVVSNGGRFDLVDLPRPEPTAGEVRVRIEACGVCGTDLHLRAAGLMPPGHTPGHEMTGFVDQLGDAAVAPPAGARVAVEPMRGCGHCAYCARGQANICRSFQLYGLHLPGGFAEFVCVPAERLHPVADDLRPEVAALTEPVAVALHGLARGGFQAGQRVLVLGAGSVGLVSLIAARDRGAGEVWISARHPHQVALARALGAARVLDEAEASPSALARLGAESEIDLVVETVGGSADTLKSACAAIRPGGSVSVLGVFLGPAEIDPFTLLTREGNLFWSNCYSGPGRRGPADFGVAADLVDRQRDALALLATHQLPLSAIGDAFAAAGDKRSGAVKVSVLP